MARSRSSRARTGSCSTTSNSTRTASWSRTASSPAPGFWWFDTYGFTPATPGSAHWDADTLILDRRSDRGRTVMRLRADGERLALELDTAVPADADPLPLVRGAYTRLPDSA